MRNRADNHVQESDRAFSKPDGLLRLLDRLRHERADGGIERLRAAPYDLEIYHQSVESVPQLMT